MAEADAVTQSITWQVNDKEKKMMLCSISIKELTVLPTELIQIPANADLDILDELHGCICNAVLVSARQAFGIKTPRGMHPVPGWTRHGVVLHDASVAAYVQWRNAVIPRNDLL